MIYEIFLRSHNSWYFLLTLVLFLYTTTAPPVWPLPSWAIIKKLVFEILTKACMKIPTPKFLIHFRILSLENAVKWSKFHIFFAPIGTLCVDQGAYWRSRCLISFMMRYKRSIFCVQIRKKLYSFFDCQHIQTLPNFHSYEITKIFFRKLLRINSFFQLLLKCFKRNSFTLDRKILKTE